MLEKEFAAGAHVFREGDPSDFAYIIRAGSVGISKARKVGELQLAVLREGDVFGEMGVLDEAPRSASARAIEPLRVVAVSREEFVSTILGQQEEGLGLLRALFERLRVMNQALLALVEEPDADAEPAADGADELRPVDAAFRIRITGLTPPAREALGGEALAFDRLPLRIGRKAASRDAGLLAFNEVALADREPFRISLNHLLIDVERQRAVARDRGSRHGAGINGRRIGGEALRMVLPLARGDNEIVLGPEDSPYRFGLVIDQPAAG
ncbi:MAG TPA: cyclic nucleotide-binding domain-containing protein [Geminicoccaceae bacterium]